MSEPQMLDELGEAATLGVSARVPGESFDKQQQAKNAAPPQSGGDSKMLQPAGSAQQEKSVINAPPEKAENRQPEGNGQRRELSNKEVTDHTAGLWRYVPIPEDEPEPAPEYKMYDTSLPGARVIGARVRGKKHKHEGSNCDDWFEVAGSGDVTFLAVSDGAGSKKFSRIGARESCKAAVGYLANQFGALTAAVPTLREDLKNDIQDVKCREACGRIAMLVQNAVLQAWDAVEAAFYSRATDAAYSDVLKRSLALSDLSGTLLVSVVVPIRKETKEYLIAACQIGDGMVAVVNSAGPFQSSLKLLGVPDSGDFSGETDFLTSAKMKKREELQKRTKLSIGAADTLLMMSDGVADDYFPNETQLRRLYYDLIANGILRDGAQTGGLSELSPDQLSLFKHIPDPIAYPWINDKTIKIPIHYTNRICDAMGLSYEELWERRDILTLASLELKDKDTLSNDAERLCLWLDNYYERGSFDDRTLVIAEL